MNTANVVTMSANDTTKIDEDFVRDLNGEDLKTEHIPVLARALMSNNLDILIITATMFRKLLSLINPPIEEVIYAGVTPTFVNLMEKYDNPRLQLEVHMS
jgi:hypothetical protein